MAPRQLAHSRLTLTHPILSILSSPQDNVFDVAPPILFFVGLVMAVKWKRQQMLKEHRD